jgi:hypothetical protein
MKRLRNSIRAFARDESGVLLAEALILLPMLIWAAMALLVYWDVFRTINVSQKAAYSVADLLSRQGVVNTQFVDGLGNVIAFLSPGVPDTRLRVTSLEYNERDDRYDLLFSRSPENKMTPHTQESIQTLRPRIPVLGDLESVIIVETSVDYVPFFDTGVLNYTPGLTNQTFREFVVTRPRNWRRVCLEGESTCDS